MEFKNYDDCVVSDEENEIDNNPPNLYQSSVKDFFEAAPKRQKLKQTELIHSDITSSTGKFSVLGCSSTRNKQNNITVQPPSLTTKNYIIIGNNAVLGSGNSINFGSRGTINFDNSTKVKNNTNTNSHNKSLTKMSGSGENVDTIKKSRKVYNANEVAGFLNDFDNLIKEGNSKDRAYDIIYNNGILLNNHY